MTEEDLQDKYGRLLREGRTEEATKVAQEMRGDDLEAEEEEDDAEAHMVYTELNGVGEELAEEMYQDFGDWDSFVEDADVDSLSDISGIGEKRAESLLEQVEEDE